MTNANQVALVTGANQGIGLQIAKDLAAKGFTVLVGSRDLKRGEEAAATIEGDARALQLDVTDAGSIKAAATRIGNEFGISVVVCSHLLGEVERICDSLIAIEGGRLLRADRISAMTTASDVLAVEVSEGTEELAAALRALDFTVTVEGRLLLVPLESDRSYDGVLRAVAELDLPLHRLDQRRHRVAELFTSKETADV